MAAPTLEADPRYRYDVVASEGAEELWIEAAFPAGGAALLVADPDGVPFVRDLALHEAGSWVTAPTEGDGWRAPACPSGCRLRYRFLLGEAARRLDHEGWAALRAGATFSPPSTWLVHPTEAPDGARYALRVRVPAGMSFATGLFHAADGFGYEAPVAELPLAPFSAFGVLRESRQALGASAIDVAVASGELSVGREALDRWVVEAATDVAGVYGKLPVERAQVLIVPTGGERIGFSRALGHGGASVLSPVGVGVSPDELADDWQMTHEMFHLAFPNLAPEHAWLEEGMATYVEPIARARRGRLDERRVWRQFVKNMPLGQPQAGDRGLDETPTWGRTYWGGAIFCLVADVEIRKRTSGAKGLEDALVAIADAGGNVAVTWPIAEVLRVGDEATGTDVLSSQYSRHKDRGEPVDLDALWKELGVERAPSEPRGVRLIDDAPLAWIRRGITGRAH